MASLIVLIWNDVIIVLILLILYANVLITQPKDWWDALIIQIISARTKHILTLNHITYILVRFKIGTAVTINIGNTYTPSLAITNLLYFYPGYLNLHELRQDMSLIVKI